MVVCNDRDEIAACDDRDEMVVCDDRDEMVVCDDELLADMMREIVTNHDHVYYHRLYQLPPSQFMLLL